MFKALQTTRHEDGTVSNDLVEFEDDALPEGDVTVDVAYSTLNYKDGLVLSGKGGLVRSWPHVSGVDFAGTVAESSHADFAPGDEVILTGWHVGERHWGGHATRARVKGEWLVPMPDGLDAKGAMAVGTAGITAMLGLMALEEAGLETGAGPVLITGATGGVGSIAAALLANAGHKVVGSTGRDSAKAYLEGLGVSEVISRESLAEPPAKPLGKETWAACIDSVGGTTLANVLAQMRYGGSVAAIGLAGGAALETTVIPFLLRGVSLLGIDSVQCPTPRRTVAWRRIATELPFERLGDTVSEVGLAELPALGRSILEGGVRGRVVVDTAR